MPGLRQTPTSNGRRSEQRQRTTLVALRLLPEEHQVLVEAAQARGISLSELLRASAMQAVADDGRHVQPA
jgi:predicted HicB family RNase H-like nuclease